MHRYEVERLEHEVLEPRSVELWDHAATCHRCHPPRDTDWPLVLPPGWEYGTLAEGRAYIRRMEEQNAALKRITAALRHAVHPEG